MSSVEKPMEKYAKNLLKTIWKSLVEKLHKLSFPYESTENQKFFQYKSTEFYTTKISRLYLKN